MWGNRGIIAYLAFDLDLLVVAVRDIPLCQPRLASSFARSVLVPGSAQSSNHLGTYCRFCIRMKDNILRCC
jgi:transposase